MQQGERLAVFSREISIKSTVAASWRVPTLELLLSAPDGQIEAFLLLRALDSVNAGITAAVISAF